MTRLPLGHRAAAILALAVLAAHGALCAARAQEGPAAEPQPQPGTPHLQADNACYVRLPDLPERRFGGFAAYNHETAMLAYAGGSEKLNQNMTLTRSDLFAIRLDGRSNGWTSVPYGDAGYAQSLGKGCSGGVNVALSASTWLSVFGKGGCDNGAWDKKGKAGGDIKELVVGGEPKPSGVHWSPNSGAQNLPDELLANKGKLSNHFAAYDPRRERLIFGQGTFNGKMAETTNNEVYAATRSGSQWHIDQLRPSGPVPARRHSSCAAYVSEPELGLDGVLVLGGQQPAPKGARSTTYQELWWLDFGESPRGEWRELTGRVSNMADFGGRSAASCAYDAEGGQFYTWAGKITKIPDGNKRSAGLWRLDVRAIADAQAGLIWERLAKDNLPGFTPRTAVPSLWDPLGRRVLMVGGQGEKGQLAEAWAVYPDVTGEACDTLNPYEAR